MPARAAPALRLKRITEMPSKIEPSDGHCKHDAHDDGCDQGDQRQSRIEDDATSQRQAISTQHAQEMDSAGADGESEQSSDKRQQGGLDDHFAHDVSPTCAKRLANG